jgi:hexosaminidase
MLAFAEVMWSEGPRDFASLRARLDQDHLPRLRAMGVAVGPADRDLLTLSMTYDPGTRAARIRMDPAPGVVVRMTRDGRSPSASSPIVADGATLGRDGVYRLQAFVGRDPILGERTLEVEHHRASGATVRLATPPDKRYPGTGDWTLTDGLRGSLDHADGLWQGWLGPDVEAVVDLGSVQPVASVSVAFLQNIRSWIVMPSRVEFSWSSDNEQWSPPVTRSPDVPVMRDGPVIQPFAVTLPAGTRTRYVRVLGRNAGPLPAGHPGAGTASWLFADEIVVK